MKSVLIISFTNLKSDPRVYRQLNFLKDHYSVSCIGLSSPEIPNVTFFKTAKEKNKFILLFAYMLLLVRQFDLFYWNQKVVRMSLKAIDHKDYDLIIANDIESLPMAEKIALRCNAKIIFDAHEYSPREHENDWKWRALFQKYNTYLLQKYTKNISIMYSVSLGLCNEYKKEFNLDAKVLSNASEYLDSAPVFNRDEAKIRLIHHGGCIPSRKIENMIEMMDYLDERFILDLMLVKSKNKYFEFLKEKAKQSKKVNFIPPVELNSIVKSTMKYDIGIYILEPNSFNNKFALPNKLFEYIQSRLVIAIGPSPEMKEVVLKHEIGIVSKDFTPRSLANEISKLDLKKINAIKEKTNIAAKKINSENNMNQLYSDIRELLEIGFTD